MDSTLSSEARTTRYAYDDHGRTVQVTDADGHTATTAYDTLNRVTLTVGPLGDTTRLSYDSLYVTGVTDALGQTYSFDRNALGWITGRTDPAGHADAYAYDANGRITSWTNRVGQTVGFGYDALGQLAWRAEGGDTTTFTTDPDGLFVAASNAASTDTVTYDAAGRVVDQITRRGSTRYVLHSRYDGEGRRAEIAATTPWTDSVGYRYDDQGRLDSLIDAGGQATTFAYDADRQTTKVIYPTGDTLWRGVASSHRTGSLSWSSSVLEAKFGQAFSEDSLGRRTAVYRGASEDTSRAYTYDSESRLTSYVDRVANAGVTCTPGSIDPNDCSFNSGYTVADSALYAYDAVGNRTDHGAVIDTADRPSSFAGYSLTWDAAGRLTSKSGNGVDESFYWSPTGRLDSIADGDTVWRYEYDGFGRRVERGKTGYVLHFLWDGSSLFAVYAGATALKATYAYFPGGAPPHSLRADAETYYLATDDLGSVLGLFGASGVANDYRYDPWGNAQHGSTTVSNWLRWAGSMLDWHEGLYAMGARSYDPELGRFISEDPLGLAAGINPYAYVGNSPVNGTDPSGMDPVNCILIQMDDGLHLVCDHGGIAWVWVESSGTSGAWPFDTPRTSGFTKNFGHRGRQQPIGFGPDPAATVGGSGGRAGVSKPADALDDPCGRALYEVLDLAPFQAFPGPGTVLNLFFDVQAARATWRDIDAADVSPSRKKRAKVGAFVGLVFSGISYIYEPRVMLLSALGEAATTAYVSNELTGTPNPTAACLQ